MEWDMFLVYLFCFVFWLSGQWFHHCGGYECVSKVKKTRPIHSCFLPVTFWYYLYICANISVEK